MIFTGLYIYLLIGLIIYMTDNEIRDIIMEMKEDSKSLDVFIFAFVVLLVLWFPMWIYSKILGHSSKETEKEEHKEN